MVANQPIERPNSNDYLVNELRELRKMVEEYTRSSRFPFSIAHGGVPDFTVLPNSDDSGAIVSIYDGAGTVVVATDPDTKYGLARPEITVPMYNAQPGLVFTSSTSYIRLRTSAFSPINSSVGIQWSVSTTWGGVGAGVQAQSYARCYDGVTGYDVTSPVFTTSQSTTGTFEASPVWAFTLPQSELTQQCYLDIHARVSLGGANSSVAVEPLFCTGWSRAKALAYGAS